MRGTETYEPADVPVQDERRRVRGARVRIDAGGQVVETTVIPPEGEGPAGWWIADARRVDELYERGLLTIKIALVEAAKEGTRGKSATIELGGDRPQPSRLENEDGGRAATSRSTPGDVKESSPEAPGAVAANFRQQSIRRVPVEQLARWRREAEYLDKASRMGSARRATASVMDVSVVLSLLDEIDRLRRTLSMHAADGSIAPGPVPAATLERWRVEAEGVLSGGRSRFVDARRSVAHRDR